MKNPTDDNLPQIAEVIVVEGRDDTAAIKRAVRAVTIETHGFGISKSTWDKIKNAHRDYGIIIFTDPDHAGEEIRRKILASYPDAKQAFLTKEKAKEKSGRLRPDIGIENASPEDIREALEKAHARVSSPSDSPSNSTSNSPSNSKSNSIGDSPSESISMATVRPRAQEEFSMKDLDAAGLSGGEGSRELREKLGDILGIGYSNAKGLLYKLNTLGIERITFDDAVKELKKN